MWAKWTLVRYKNSTILYSITVAKVTDRFWADQAKLEELWADVLLQNKYFVYDDNKSVLVFLLHWIEKFEVNCVSINSEGKVII